MTRTLQTSVVLPSALLMIVAASACGGSQRHNPSSAQNVAVSNVPTTDGSQLPPKPNYDQIRKTLAENRERWRVNGPTSYTFELIRASFAYTPPVQVEVRDSRVLRASEVGSGKMLGRTGDLLDRLGTIERIFAVVDTACNAGFDRIEVDYDRTVGFPRRVYLVSSFHVSESDERITVDRLHSTRK